MNAYRSLAIFRNLNIVCTKRAPLLLLLLCFVYLTIHTLQNGAPFKIGEVTAKMISECERFMTSNKLVMGPSINKSLTRPNKVEQTSEYPPDASPPPPAYRLPPPTPRLPRFPKRPSPQRSRLRNYPLKSNRSKFPGMIARAQAQARLQGINKTKLRLVPPVKPVQYIPKEPLPTLSPETEQQCKAVQQKRLTTMRQSCSKIRTRKVTDAELIRWASSSLSIVLKREKALYCFIPKVACSSWKIKILTEYGVLSSKSYNGSDTFHHDMAMQSVLARYKIKTLKEYPPKEALYILKNYFKFIFVRDPYERLISGYRDKMLDANNTSYRPVAEAIIRRGANKKKKFPEFHEFLDFISEGQNMSSDIHWQRYTDLCNPCLVDYDFVGKVSNLAQDVECVLPKINMKPWFPLPKNARSSGDKIAKYYSKVPKRIRNKCSDLLANDLAVFGYTNLTAKGIV